MSTQLALARMPLDRVFNSFFGDRFLDMSPADYAWEETEAQYAIEYDIPGVKKEDLQIHAEGDQLWISGERKGARAGTFKFALALPRGIDAAKISASQQDGVLRITAPKAESEKRRLISIQ